MVDGTFEQVVPVGQAPEVLDSNRTTIRWGTIACAAGAFALSAAPIVVTFTAVDRLNSLTPGAVATIFVIGAALVATVLAAIGNGGNRAPVWLTIVCTALGGASAARLTNVSPAIAADWTAITIVHAASLGPAFVASLLRLAGSLDHEPTARRPVGGASALTVAQFGALGAFAAADQWLSASPYASTFFVSAFALAAVPPVAVAALAAVRQRRFPVRYNQEPPYGHITSLSVLLLFLFITVIAGLELWSEYRSVDARITRNTGLAAVLGLAVAFALVALAPTSQHASRSIDTLATAIERSLGGLSKHFSWMDAVLVFAIAPVVGATQTRRAAPCAAN
jgi:hypothetical protein